MIISMIALNPSSVNALPVNENITTLHTTKIEFLQKYQWLRNHHVFKIVRSIYTNLTVYTWIIAILKTEHIQNMKLRELFSINDLFQVLHSIKKFLLPLTVNSFYQFYTPSHKFSPSFRHKLRQKWTSLGRITGIGSYFVIQSPSRTLPPNPAPALKWSIVPSELS